ncbi:hypothetical protein BC830DRAFT_1104880 [Chytriomyces sp. MP71]|nr:hypothetical protein BC830DRAFT_1104880 [Chytriomyces sp. MP71]
MINLLHGIRAIERDHVKAGFTEKNEFGTGAETVVRASFNPCQMHFLLAFGEGSSNLIDVSLRFEGSRGF